MNLGDLTPENREVLAKKFIEEVILPQWKQLQSWGNFTSQTAQIDFGYLGQHLVSILCGIPGNKNRGKGEDLADGSEVKSASCLDAIDTPRWNNVNCGCKHKEELLETYNRMPYLFFVLLDTTKRLGDILRCRVWVIRPKEDRAFMNVALGWAEENDKRKVDNRPLKSNFQLHPPRWEKALENITTNEMGNLKLPLVYYCEQLPIEGILVMETKLYKPEAIRNGLSEPVER